MAEELGALLERAGRMRDEALGDWTGAPWKIAIAQTLRQSTTATNRWIARPLHMGAASSVSLYLSLARAGKIKLVEA